MGIMRGMRGSCWGSCRVGLICKAVRAEVAEKNAEAAEKAVGVGIGARQQLLGDGWGWLRGRG